MIRALLIGLGICVACVASGEAARPRTEVKTYHSDEFGYSITIPEGWTRIPDSDLRAATQRIFSDELLEKLTFEVAMQRRASEPFTYPYAWVQIERYPSGHQISERGMRQYIKNMTALSEEDIRKHIKEGASEVAADLKNVKIDFDPETRTFSSSHASETEGAGRTRACMYGWFGHRSVISVAFYTRDDEFERCQPALEQMRKSFKFDPGMEYQPVDWFASQTFAWVLIVGASSVLALVLRRK